MRPKRKSDRPATLVKILAGVVTPDEGTIEVDGRIRPVWQPIDAVHAGFEVIYQDFSLFPNLTVAENIAFSDQLLEGRRLVSWRPVKQIAEQGLRMVGVDVPLNALVEELSVADKQIVAARPKNAGDAKDPSCMQGVPLGGGISSASGGAAARRALRRRLGREKPCRLKSCSVWKLRRIKSVKFSERNGQNDRWPLEAGGPSFASTTQGQSRNRNYQF